MSLLVIVTEMLQPYREDLIPDEPRRSGVQHARPQSNPAVEGIQRISHQLPWSPSQAGREMVADTNRNPVGERQRRCSSQVISVQLSTTDANQPDIRQPRFRNLLGETICLVCGEPYIAHFRTRHMMPRIPGPEVSPSPVLPDLALSISPASALSAIEESLQTPRTTSQSGTQLSAPVQSAKRFWIVLVACIALVQYILMFGLGQLDRWASRK